MSNLIFNSIPELLEFVASNNGVKIDTDSKSYTVLKGDYLADKVKDDSLKGSGIYLLEGDEVLHQLSNLNDSVKYFKKYNISLNSFFSSLS